MHGMNLRSNRLLVAASAVAVAAAGAGAGVGIYASVDQGKTTTVIKNVTTVDSSQQIAATTGLTVTEIYQRAYKGVVDITVGGSSSFSFGRGGGQGQTGEGSGFVYDSSGDIVTNQHVVDGASSITVKFWNGSKYTAHLVGTDPSTDLAVIKVNAPKSLLHPLTLGNSDAVQVGSGVVAIGSPFGLAESVTSGIVSALHREMTSPNQFTIPNSIQTDAPINHGNSGGPLLNAQGQVIGVNAQIQSESGGNDGVGFAIPSNTVRSIVSQIVSSGSAKHPYLGVSLEDSNSGTGAVVGGLTAGTPAIRAGLQCGDVITRIDGTSMGSASAVTNTLGAKKPGDTIDVTYSRGGKSHTVRITLGTRPADTSTLSSAC
jgi:putative serine protease PepD